jgi:hypothetical protein
LENAARAGIDPIKFWEYTPFELDLLIKKYIDDEKMKNKYMIAQAWHTEHFSRLKKLPKLNKVLENIEKKNSEPMTPESMLEEIKRMNAQFGGDTY